MKKILKPSVLLPAFLLLLNCVTANAELNAYMTVTVANQGQIIGDVILSGKEGTFEINEFHHLFEKDSTELTTVHSLIITTRMSRGMPLLLRSFDNSEVLSPVVINFYRPNTNTGTEENYYTMTLINAKLVMVEPIMLDNVVPANLSISTRFRMRFDYEQIGHHYILNGEQTIIVN